MNAKLTIRMAAPSIVISLLLLTLGILGGWYLLWAQKSASAKVAVDVFSIRAVEELVFSLYELRLRADPIVHRRRPGCTCIDPRPMPENGGVAAGGRKADGRSAGNRVGQTRPGGV